MGIALRFDEGSGRWSVRLRDGDGKSLKPANLEPLAGGGESSGESGEGGEGGGQNAGVVHVVWGDAQWSRTQLLGEIARGHWGLCRASVAEIAAPAAGAPASTWTKRLGEVHSARRALSEQVGARRSTAGSSSPPRRR